MANRATISFVFSVIGGAYQLISPNLAALVDRNNSAYYFVYGFDTLILTTFIVFWSASHLLEDWKGRITWPFLIFVLGAAELSSIIMVYFIPNVPGTLIPNTTMLNASLTLVPGPIIITVGGILGFIAVRQYSREHGRAVIAHA